MTLRLLAATLTLLPLGCGNPPTATESELVTGMYRVPPDFERLHQGSIINEDQDNLFGPNDRLTAREQLEELGITFPEGSVVFTNLPYSGIGMHNTHENHQRFREYLDRKFPGKWGYGGEDD